MVAKPSWLGVCPGHDGWKTDGSFPLKLPSVLFAPDGEGVEVGRVRRRVEAERLLAGADAFGDEVFVGGHFDGVGGDFIDDAGGDDDHAVRIADDDVAWEERSVAAADRDVDVDR